MAAAIGVAPNAVYTYFPTRAALVEHLLATLEVEEHADWRDSLRAVALRLHGLLSRHPGVVPFFVAGLMFGPTALAAGEKVLRLLGEAGFAPDAAVRALYTLLVYTIGFAAMDAAEIPAGTRTAHGRPSEAAARGLQRGTGRGLSTHSRRRHDDGAICHPGPVPQRTRNARHGPETSHSGGLTG